jgi:hypothetical protein
VPAHDVRPPVLVKVAAEILPRLRHPRSDIPRAVLELDVELPSGALYATHTRIYAQVLVPI